VAGADRPTPDYSRRVMEAHRDHGQAGQVRGRQAVVAMRLHHPPGIVGRRPVGAGHQGVPGGGITTETATTAAAMTCTVTTLAALSRNPAAWDALVAGHPRGPRPIR
jgi:hypothetical protein